MLISMLLAGWAKDVDPEMIRNDVPTILLQLWPLTVINGTIMIYRLIVIVVIIPFITIKGQNCASQNALGKYPSLYRGPEKESKLV